MKKLKILLFLCIVACTLTVQAQKQFTLNSPDGKLQTTITVGDKLTYDIHYQIRLVEASSYDIDSYATLKGFVSGLYAGNYDITHIFIDSLCKIVPGPCDNETEKFLDWLNAFGEKHGIKFTITISDDASLAPEGIKKYF